MEVKPLVNNFVYTKLGIDILFPLILRNKGGGLRGMDTGITHMST